MGFLARWLFRAVLMVLLVVTLVVAAVAFVLNTETGTRWVLARADQALPGSLVVTDYDGTIWQGLRLDSVVYSDATQRLTIEGVSFDLFWPAIFAGRLTIDDLKAQSFLRESLAPPPDEPEPLQIEMQRLPLAMGLRHASIGRLTLSDGEQVQELQSIVVRGLSVDGRLFEAEEVRAQRNNVSIKAKDLSVRLAGPVATTADVSWKLLDAEWSGKGTVAGSLTELGFQQQVSGPYPANVSGELFLVGRLQPAFAAQIDWQSWTIAGTPFENGEVALRGTFDEAEANYRTLLVTNGDQYTLEGSATGNLEALSSFSANITNDQVDLDLDGSLILKPELSATAAAAAHYIDPQLISSGLRGELAASAALAVDATGAVTLNNLVAAGAINDIPVQGQGNAWIAAGRWRCSNCILKTGPNRIVIDGEQSAAGMKLTASLDAPDLSQLWPGLVGAANGTATVEDDKGDIALSWQHEDMAVSTNAGIRYSDQQLSGTVRGATITQARVGDWVLQDPFAFLYADNSLELGSNDWLGELGSVRIARLVVGGDSLQVQAGIQNVPLAMGNQALPPNYQLSGYASADVDLDRTAGLWNGTLQWSQRDTRLRVIEANGEITDLNVLRAEASVNLADSTAVADGYLEMDPGVAAELSVSLEALAPAAPMTGKLKLSGADWSWIAALVPQIDTFSGAISADVAARGPLNAPTFSGTANWRDGGLSIPSLNTKLKEVGVTVTGASDGDATVEGSARSGGGTLQLTGRLEDLMLPERRATFSVTGKGAELVNWPEYHVWGTPDIVLRGNFDAWNISGQLEVPRASITPREVPVSAVKVSPDVRVLGEEGTVARETPVTGETRLILGDDVKFAALGLETRLRGDILFKLVADRPVRAEGRLTLVEGTYETQGQKLKIERGELVFTGPLDDPLVDVRAVRVINDFDGTVKAGIRLQGRAQNLTTTVYSEPAMADADALSYLVLGRPLSQASDTEGGEISGAAVALGLRQVTRITDQIGQSIGVDELSLSGDGGDATALVAGKQVNSRLYARYAYGVFSQLGSLLLRYRLNRNLTLEAGAGENQSLDILYTIEK